MKTLTTHEQIKVKITAFLFNKKSDALRSEMYRALCLHVLSDADQPLSKEDVAELVASALGSEVKLTDSLRAVVFQTLQDLINEKIIVNKNGNGDEYILTSSEIQLLPDSTAQNELYEVIKKEITQIAREINPRVMGGQLDALFDFYLEISNIVAAHQIKFISQGIVNNGVEIEERSEISERVSEITARYAIDTILGGQKDIFIFKTLLRPSSVLVDYLYRLIQVNVITRLLAWDPDLAYLQRSILSGKTLYLDSSILFVISQKSHSLHHLLLSVLGATRNELNVRLVVHEETLREYEHVLVRAEDEFNREQRNLREIIKSCKKYGENPVDWLDSSILSDFIVNNSEKVDLHSWQKYRNSITGKNFTNTLKSLSIEIDSNSIFVPDPPYEDLKEKIILASKHQVENKRKGKIKQSPEHDAKLFYYLNSKRSKGESGESSLGYNTYLMTLDGSLVNFIGKMRIPYVETYFIYPNQWYEVTFPFLRINATQIPGFISGMTSLVFSSAFPALMPLVPLELCSYVFDSGGMDLPMGSIHNVICSLVEERLIDSLTSDGNDYKRQEAQIRIQQLIAEEVKNRSHEILDLERKSQDLNEKQEVLQVKIEALTEEQKNLDESLQKKRVSLSRYDELDSQLLELEEKRDKELRDLRSANEEKLAQKEAELNLLIKQKEEIVDKNEIDIKDLKKKQLDMQNELDYIRDMQNKEKERFEIERINKNKRIKNFIKVGVIVLMVFGVLTGVLISHYLQINLIITGIVTVFLLIGLILYLLEKNAASFIVYTLGLLVFVGCLIQSSSDLILWIIPFCLDGLAFLVDRIGKKETAKEEK